MQVKTETRDGVFIITIIGKMQGCADDVNLHELYKKQIESGQRLIVINMNKAEYINSSGIGVLFACYQTLHAVHPFGNKVAISQPNKKNRRLLEITKMIQFFDVYESDEQAIATLKS